MWCSIGLLNSKYFFVMYRWSTAINKTQLFFNAPKHVRFGWSKTVSTTRGAVASSFVCELLLPSEGARSANQKPKHTHTHKSCKRLWVTEPISSIPLFSQFYRITKHWLPIKYHIHIWQVSLQLSCSDTCQIWKWFSEHSRYFCRIENFLNRKIKRAVVTPTL